MRAIFSKIMNEYFGEGKLIEKIMKAVKSSNKKRGRNITVGAVVGFLLSCTSVMGAEETGLEINNLGNGYKLKLKRSFWEFKLITDDLVAENDSEIDAEEASDTAPTPTEELIAESSSENEELETVEEEAIEILPTPAEEPLAESNSENEELETVEEEAIEILPTPIEKPLTENSSDVSIVEDKGVIFKADSETSKVENVDFEKLEATYIDEKRIAGDNRDSEKNLDPANPAKDKSTEINAETVETENETEAKNTISNRNIGTEEGNAILRAENRATVNGIADTEAGTIGLEIDNSENGIVFSKDGSTFDPNAEDNPYPDNSWEEATKTYTNNAVISGKGDNASGLKIESETNSEKFNLINDGSITGSASSYEGYGYGICIDKGGSITELLNNGSITGSATYSGSGYGIYISKGGSIEKLKNNGSITGSGSGYDSGYGIYIYSGGSITKLKNNGLITGSTGGFSYGINNRGSIEKLKNNGLITGSGFNGYGISNNETIGALTNTGVIYGTTNAIYNYESAKINGANNYGILASSGSMVNNNLTIVDKSSPSTLATNTTEKENKIFNYGLAFTVASVGSYKATDEAFKTFGTTQENEEVIVGYEKDDAGNLTTPIKHEYTIINAKDTGTGKNSITGTESITIKNGSLSYDYKNNTSGPLKTHQAKSVILNGITDTLLVSGNSDDNILNNSVVNAYGTAVKFNDAGGNLTLSGTVVNGGIDGKAAVSGSGNGDTLILQSGDITYVVGTPGTQSTETQNTIVNGNINMGEGDDILTIEAGSIVNGTMDGGTDTGRADDDTINFGTASNTRAASGIDDNINILHNISNFENMNINTNVTLFEKTVDSDGNPTDLKVSGAENITIGANGVLTLRIAKNDTGDNTHALYGNNGIISSNGGKLLLALNGAGNGEIISFGTTELDDNTLVSGKDGTLDTTSKFHTVEKIDEKNVKVIVKVNIPEILKYKQLNKIYCSIVSVNDLIGNFNVDSDENLTLFLGYLNNIYAGNPYSYSSELSRKSTGMFRDIVTDNQFKANTGKWMIYGGLTHVDGGTKDT